MTSIAAQPAAAFHAALPLIGSILALVSLLGVGLSIGLPAMMSAL